MQEGWAKDFKFTVDKPTGWSTATPVALPWVTPTPEVPQAYQSDENLKKQYGIELAKSANAFEAACKIFGEETNKALWVSYHWLSDPVVVASKDIYLKTVALSTPLLDREQLAAKVLALAEEKILTSAGVLLPTIEAKDRIAALKLYSDIAGYTGKVEIDNSTIKNITNNELKITFVKPQEKATVIDHKAPVTNVKSELVNSEMPITLKLVGGAAR